MAVERVNTVARFSARWRGAPDAFVARSISERQVVGEMVRILSDRDSMLVAEQQMDANIQHVRKRRITSGRNAFRIQRWLFTFVGLLAVIAVVVVAWFARRVRRLSYTLSGVGIGLAMSTRIVEAIGGAITVRSERDAEAFSHDVPNSVSAAATPRYTAENHPANFSVVLHSLLR